MEETIDGICVSSGLLTHLEITELQSLDRFRVKENGLGFGLCPEDKGIDRLAQAAYHDYGAVTNHLNYQGLPMPNWEDLTDKIRDAWRNATLSILINSYYDATTTLVPTDKPFNPQGLI